MAVQQAAMSGVPFNLQFQATSGNGFTLAVPSSFRNHNIEVQGGGGVASGTVVVETSNDPTDGGTWAQLAAPITVLASTDLLVQYTGLINFIRARISANIVGGSVTVQYTGAKSF